jgi:hypothetical protein
MVKRQELTGEIGVGYEENLSPPTNSKVGRLPCPSAR